MKPAIHSLRRDLLFFCSKFLLEQKLNAVLSIFKVGYQDAPYTNSIELVERIKEATPDSLKYVINDMFETITLYDNRIKRLLQKN
jgi:ABC-2 type transport system permease protein